MADEGPFKEGNGGVFINCHVQPGASKSGVSGLHGSSVKLKLHAPPVDGKANTELVKFIADFFGVSKSAVEIKAGQSSRQKVLFVSGVSADSARKLLP